MAITLIDPQMGDIAAYRRRFPSLFWNMRRRERPTV